MIDTVYICIISIVDSRQIEVDETVLTSSYQQFEFVGHVM